MGQIRSFRDLIVYQRARRASNNVFLVSTAFPKSETYALTDQIRRSSRAVGALLAEAWGRRRYPAAFVEKLTQALAEAKETQAWLDHALDCAYPTPDEHARLDAEWDEIAAMLHRMSRQPDRFCKTQFR
jgi:four helix bundle protein